MRTMSITLARKLIEEAGGRVRITGGGLIDDPAPQMEAKPPGGQWQYVCQLPEGEASADHVEWWIEQNLEHRASSHDTDTPYWPE